MTTRARLDGLAGTRAHEDLPHGCQCGNRWSGANTCHCGACHISTTGVTTFDAHRVGGRCVPPASVGLVLVSGRAYDVWGTRGIEETAA